MDRSPRAVSPPFQENDRVDHVSLELNDFIHNDICMDTILDHYLVKQLMFFISACLYICYRTSQIIGQQPLCDYKSF